MAPPSCPKSFFNSLQSSLTTAHGNTHASRNLMRGNTKVEHSSATLAKMIRAALKMWQFVAKYTTKPLLSQGVEGDMAMAKNSRRVFNVSAQPEERAHIAFLDKIKLLTPEKVIFHHTPSAPRVVALANWEAAPTFVLDDHLGSSFPKVSTDRFLNKCNPFLSGKRRAHSDDDIASEAPTVSTDCSAIPESDVEGQKLDVVEEEVKEEEKTRIIVETQARQAKVDQVPRQAHETNATRSERNKSIQLTKPNPQTVRWICVGYGRYVKRAVEQTPELIAAKVKACS